jgi:hypothetical protein
MPLQFQRIEVESPFGVTIRNTFLTHEPASDKLMILLPGRGYTNDHPVMHYVAKVGMQLGYDALAVQYGFQVSGADLTPDKLPLVSQDVSGAVTQALQRPYKRVVIVGKSMGTPLAVEVAKTLSQQVSLILLTPVGGAMQGLGGLRTLAVIGTSDAAYSAEEVQSFESVSTVTWRVFDNLNHALELADDWRGSVQVLEEIIAACDTFLREV